MVLLGSLIKAASSGPDDVLRTVVGTGAPGYSGDGGPATAAQLREPFHVSFGPRGELYVAEAANHCIRRVDPDGKIRTVAGCGRKGYSGDGGPATAATLNEPYGVVADRRGNLFIVDRLNACVRRVDAATGVISTLAGTGTPGYSGDGGPATAAQLKEPNGLALDGRGHLFVADVSDNRIRRIDLEAGQISTVAGTGRRAFSGDGGPAAAASIQGARAVDADGEGNLYVCEREGNRIRRIDARSGVIRTIAGTGAEGYSGDGGPALAATFRGPKWISLDGEGGLYVVDTENHCVRRIDLRSGRIATVAGDGKQGSTGDGGPATAARLDRPHGCCVRDGILYVADTNNHRVRACPAR
jgi:sugar lactone lactonase YvrE